MVCPPCGNFVSDGEPYIGAIEGEIARGFSPYPDDVL